MLLGRSKVPLTRAAKSCPEISSQRHFVASAVFKQDAAQDVPHDSLEACSLEKDRLAQNYRENILIWGVWVYMLCACVHMCLFMCLCVCCVKGVGAQKCFHVHLQSL